MADADTGPRATVIDSLVVTLGLDSSKFTQGQKDAVTAFTKAKTESVSTAKEMEARGAQAAQFFGSIKKEALGLFAVIVGAGGLEQFAVKTTSSMAALGRQAQLMGVAAGDLQAFKMMIDRTGASGDQAAASLTGLAEAMETYRTRGTISAGLLTGLNQIGGTQDDDALAIYRKFATWAKGKDARFVNQEGQLLGLDAGSIANATKGGANFDSEMARSKALGVPTDKDIAKVNELMGAFKKLTQEITGDSNALLYGMAPALTTVFNLSGRLAGANKTLTQTFIALGTALATVGGIWASSGVLGMFKRFFSSPKTAKAAEVEAAKAAEKKAAQAAARKAAAEAAGHIGGALLRGVARVAGPLGLAYDLLHPDALNVGEDAHMAAINARFHARQAAASASGGAASDDDGLPAGLLHAIYGQESSYGKNAGLSRAGAMGPFQLMPATAQRFGVTDRSSYAQESAAAAKYLQWLIRRYHGDTDKAIAGYNWGEGHVDKDIARHGAAWRNFLPKETSNYIKGVHAKMGGAGTSVQIGQIVVHTQATDARGIANGIGPAVRSSITRQAGGGLTG
jgi:soluble lytic murein transglycosylase-like protein